MGARIPSQPMADIKLNRTDILIIEELGEGRNVPSNIADAIEKNQQYVRDRLTRLEEWSVVHNLGRGVYELNEEEVPDYE